MIDDFLGECGKIAEKYHTTVVDVATEYSRLQLEYQRQMVDIPCDILLSDTENYFRLKNKLDKDKGNDLYDG